jgi:RNA polymerase sigma-70 factor (ECF subfamily)
MQESRTVREENKVVANEGDARGAERVKDASVLAALLARQERPLYLLCRGVLGHADDAEDAVQETFLRALRALPRFRGEADLRTWVFRIAINLCLEWKGARRPVETGGELPAKAASPTASPETTVLRHLRVLEALHALLPRHRAIFLLKELEGWSVAEIAAALRCTQRRIYYELNIAHRALAAWRQRDAEEGAEP